MRKKENSRSKEGWRKIRKGCFCINISNKYLFPLL